MLRQTLLLVCCLMAIGLQAQVLVQGTTTLERSPWNFYYNKSYSQNIYAKELINASGNITGIKLFYDGNATSHSNEVKLFMGHTSQDVFSGPDNWLAHDEMTEVYVGEQSFVPGTWITFTFDTPFAYNGTDNLVLAAWDLSEGYNSMNDKFKCFTDTGNSTLMAYSDNNEISPDNLPLNSVSGTTNVVGNYLPHIELMGIQANCPTPTNVEVGEIGQSTVDLTWNDMEVSDGYRVVYKANADFNPMTETEFQEATTTTNSISLTDLSPSTDYFVYIQSVCSSSESSTYAGPISFRTNLAPVDVPYFQGFEGESFPPGGWTLETIAGNPWTHQTSTAFVYEGEKALRYQYSATSAADSWIFTVGVNLQAGYAYDISFFQRVYASNYTEKMKLTVGRTATIEGQTTVLWDNDNLTNTSFSERNATFTPTESGVYYFAFHAYSNSNEYYIYVDNFKIEQGEVENIFSLNETQIGNYWFSSQDWGDYDNDGDMDLLISGGLASEDNPYEVGPSTIHIYTNDGNGNLTLNEEISIQGMHTAHPRWIDFDNDGDLDIIAIGMSYAEGVNLYNLYENNDGVFTSVEANGNGASFGTVSLGDYDNDGDLDILTTGYTEYKTRIFEYTDEGYVVNDITATIPGVFDGAVNWADIDNDGDLDIIIAGSTQNDGASLRIYTNENGSYTLAQNITTYATYRNFALGDFNNDGFVDLAIKAIDAEYDEWVEILVNNNGNFEQHAVLPGLNSFGAATPLAWGDFDNDGLLDLAVSGTDSDYNGKVILYRNADNQFVEVPNTGFDPVGGYSVTWQDMDGDLDLDLFITGLYDDPNNGEYYGTSRIYMNQSITANTAPVAPTSLNSSNSEGMTMLSWSGASDAQTPEDGLSYILQVGTSSGAIDVAHYPVSGTSWKLNLPEGQDYYWCVKSVDTSFISSTCSEEQMISGLGTNDVTQQINGLQLFPNPVKSGIIHLNTHDLEGHDLVLNIFNTMGQLMMTQKVTNAPNLIEIPVHELVSGSYFLNYISEQKTSSIQFIVR